MTENTINTPLPAHVHAALVAAGVIEGQTVAPEPEAAPASACGATTKAGGACRNEATSCRWHAGTPEPAPEGDFVEWLRESAPARHSRKATNKALAAAMRAEGLTPNGAEWDYAKKLMAEENLAPAMAAMYAREDMVL